jgi:hypothetical protein
MLGCLPLFFLSIPLIFSPATEIPFANKEEREEKEERISHKE